MRTLTVIRQKAVWATALAALAGVAFAAYESTSLVDIPTNEYLDHLQYEFDFVGAASADPAVSSYGVVNANLGLVGWAETGLTVNSIWERTEVTAHFKVEALDGLRIARVSLVRVPATPPASTEPAA